ncbi:MAG: hypothetical protein KatS3mg118_2017 [Paracoccaceae bacterium]|nr:MAG: hypothetical protein KatS3mg118_2017 [Paracoccaceae bacterium]
MIPKLPPRDGAAAASARPDLGPMPEWRLDDLYAGEDDPKLAADLDWLAAEAAAFAADYKDRLAGLDAAEIARCIARYERIGQVSGRIMSFAGLRHYQNTTDPLRGKFYGDMQARLTEISSALVFFSLELNRVPDEVLEGWYADSPEVARYRPWLRRLRAFRPYQLSDELERFLHDHSVVGATAWNRLFDETMAALEFEVDGETLGLEATLNLLTDTDRARRQAAARRWPGCSARACRCSRGS